jgi:hypothetical protein
MPTVNERVSPSVSDNDRPIVLWGSRSESAARVEPFDGQDASVMNARRCLKRTAVKVAAMLIVFMATMAAESFPIEE